MRLEKPSITARKVALNTIALGAKRGMEDILPPNTVDATAELLTKSGVASIKTVNFARTQLAVGIYLAFDWMMPGQFVAFAYRKAFCEQQVRQGIEEGARQVLVLGAGYDTLGWRLAQEFSNVNFFEIDHPATSNPKSKGIKSMGLPTKLQLIAEDLGKVEFVDVLTKEEIWDTTVQTVIVAEGLLMYLPVEAVCKLFEQCAIVTGANSRIAFTYVASKSNGEPGAGPWSWLVLGILKAGGEPWLWSISTEELPHFLKKHGWTVVNVNARSPEKHGIEFYGTASNTLVPQS